MFSTAAASILFRKLHSKYSIITIPNHFESFWHGQVMIMAICPVSHIVIIQHELEATVRHGDKPEGAKFMLIVNLAA